MKTWITPSIEALDVRMTKSGNPWGNAEGVANNVFEPVTSDAGNAGFVEAMTSPSPSPEFVVLSDDS